jgi:phosphohistidine phosphatase SixA
MLRSTSFRLCAASLAGLLLCAASAVRATAADDSWALMKKPGHIVLLRHSNAPGSVPESNDMDMKNCAIQRNLDAEGKAQAARIGDEFRKHKIGKLKLVSSEYCRAMETGRLMKLGPVTPLRVLNQVFLADIPGMREAGVKAREYMKKIPAKQLTVLITHVTNIQSIASAKLDSGEMIVVHFDPAGEVVVDGKIMVP